MGFFSALKNFSYVTAGRVVLRGANILKTVFVARIIGLGPAEFGLFGIATLVTGLIEIATETGINVFLLQEKGPADNYVNTAWVVSLLRGLVISLIIFLSSPVVATTFHSKEALGLIQLISLVPLIRGFIHPLCVSFQKQLKFNLDFFYRSAIVTVELLATAFLCFLTKSAYGLIWGLIISALFETFLSLIIFHPFPKLLLIKSQLQQIVSRGKHVTAYGVFDYVYTNADNIVVGMFLGNTALGLYQNAYRLSTTAASETMGIFYKVSLPTFVQISHHKPTLLTQIKKFFLPYLFLLALFNLLVFIFAQPLVTFLFGPAWLAAIPLVKILSFMGSVRAITYFTNSLFVSLKLQQYISIITFTSMFTLLISIVPFVKIFALPGAGYSALLASLSAIPVTLYYLKKTIHRL